MLPTGTRLLEILGDLGVPGAEIDSAVRLRPRLDDRPDLVHAAETARTALLAGLGSAASGSEPPPFEPPDPTGTDDPLLRHFWLWVYAGAYDEVRGWHREYGVDDDVSRRTLADLGRHVTHTRRRYGQGGWTTNIDWLGHHFRGELYQLGRLQVELGRLGPVSGGQARTLGLTDDVGGALVADTPVLGVHIPDYCGPFTRAQCEDSLARAAAFVPAHFPDFVPAGFSCHSWLLDEQLLDYLAPTSNIVAFRALFADHGAVAQREAEPDDLDFVRTVFGVPTLDRLDELPQRSSVERAIVGHLRDGGHWYGGIGWRPWASVEPATD